MRSLLTVMLCHVTTDTVITTEAFMNAASDSKHVSITDTFNYLTKWIIALLIR